MKRYAIWNKTDPVITPIGEFLTAEQWIERYPVAGAPNITVVCAAGEINGAFFGTLGQMRQIYEAEGCDFSACETPEEILEAIEAFEDYVPEVSNEPTPEERTATALEALASGQTTENMAAMDALLNGEG